MEIRIDRLRVQVHGMTKEAARQFGQLLAEQLAAQAAVPAGLASARTGLTTVRVSIPAPGGLPPGALATAAATEVSRALASRAPASRAPVSGAPVSGAPLPPAGAR